MNSALYDMDSFSAIESMLQFPPERCIGVLVNQEDGTQ